MSSLVARLFNISERHGEAGAELQHPGLGPLHVRRLGVLAGRPRCPAGGWGVGGRGEFLQAPESTDLVGTDISARKRFVTNEYRYCTWLVATFRRTKDASTESCQQCQIGNADPDWGFEPFDCTLRREHCVPSKSNYSKLLLSAFGL